MRKKRNLTPRAPWGPLSAQDQRSRWSRGGPGRLRQPDVVSCRLVDELAILVQLAQRRRPLGAVAKLARRLHRVELHDSGAQNRPIERSLAPLAEVEQRRLDQLGEALSGLGAGGPQDPKKRFVFVFYAGGPGPQKWQEGRY